MMLQEAIIEVCGQLNAPDSTQYAGVYVDSTDPSTDGYDGRAKDSLFLSFSEILGQKLRAIENADIDENKAMEESLEACQTLAHGLIEEVETTLTATGIIDLRSIGAITYNILKFITIYSDKVSTDYLTKNITFINPVDIYKINASFIDNNQVVIARFGDKFRILPVSTDTPEWTIEGKIVKVVILKAPDPESIVDSSELLDYFSKDLISNAISMAAYKLRVERGTID